MHIEMTEQQMRTRGGLMDELLEKAFDAAVIVDRDGRFVYNTKGSLALRGLALEEIAGKYYWEINPGAKFHTTLESGRAQLGVIDVVEGRKCLVNIFPMFSDPILIAVCVGIVNVTCNMFSLSGTMILVSKWFPRKKGTVMGIITSGGLGASLVLVPLFNIFNSSFDVKAASLVTGLLLVAYGVSSIFWLRETPQEVGLLPDNKPVDAELEKIMATQKGGWTSREMLRCKKWWLGSLGWSATMFAIIGFITIAVTYMLSRGVPEPMAIKAS